MAGLLVRRSIGVLDDSFLSCGHGWSHESAVHKLPGSQKVCDLVLFDRPGGDERGSGDASTGREDAGMRGAGRGAGAAI
ncbi:hypothetical protein CFK38_15180 [Brachybacterium vulturis]|uniref:Uncharacterized protein n=1 Tax=Brachybacterium vulturis TaxID=2017484 RepID=A0A291GQT0_9MICO|nr:hypothetical protein CFK38_15180 [Brachybacterium vulturis]